MGFEVKALWCGRWDPVSGSVLFLALVQLECPYVSKFRFGAGGLRFGIVVRVRGSVSAFDFRFQCFGIGI